MLWKTSLKDIEEAFNNAQKVTEKRILTKSAGERPVYMLAYGKKKQKGFANYSSALGAHDKKCYSPSDRRTIILIGAVHGQETEGTAALMHLISLLETGYDLDGKENAAFSSIPDNVRIVIVPVANPDGRARVVPDSMVGLTNDELRYWAQGTWEDGSLCGWPECKKIHPILGHEGFLGGYYNDDGINLMHDNFFHTFAKETQAILDLCEEECADYIIHLHGGSNSVGDLLQPFYVPTEINLKIQALSMRCKQRGMSENLDFYQRPVPDVAKGENPPSFNLVCAAHHVCGGVSVCFESNQCIIDEPGKHLTQEQIIRTHMILFEECIKTVAGE